jgi:hypothetical protein
VKRKIILFQNIQSFQKSFTAIWHFSTRSLDAHLSIVERASGRQSHAVVIRLLSSLNRKLAVDFVRPPCCCLTFYKNKCIKKSCIFFEDLLQYKLSGPYTKCTNIAPISEISSAAIFELLIIGNYKVKRCGNLQLYFLYTKFRENQ